MSSDSLQQFVDLGCLVINVDANLFSFGSDRIQELSSIWTIGRIDLEHAFNHLS